MIESFSAFHDQFRERAVYFASVSVLLPFFLLARRLLLVHCADSDTPCFDQTFRVKRTLLWMQQCGFGLSSLVLLQDHYLKSTLLSVEPDVVVAVLLACAVVLDTHLAAHEKYLRLSWLPLYFVAILYTISDGLANPTVSHTSAAVVCPLAGLIACVHLVVDIYVPQKNAPPAEFTCDLLTFCVFSFVTKPILLLALHNGCLTINDVPGLVDHDTCEDVYRRLSTATASSLMLRLFVPIKSDTLRQGICQFLSSLLNFATPLALGRLVSYVSNYGSPEGNESGTDSFGGISISVEIALVVLFVAPVIKAVIDGQLLATGRHIGIRIKASVISLIFNKALVVDLTATSDGIGKLNNMISVDASAIQNFMCYCHSIWSAFFEIMLSVWLLYLVLGPAAFAGVVGMIVSVPSCFYLTKLMTYYQDELLARKDSRMSSVSEILLSIRIIKLFAWEERFEDQIKGLRSSELQSLRGYMFSRAGMGVLWDAIPTVVAVMTFLFRSYVLEQSLTAAQGYSGLMMFTLLKRPLASFPEMSGWCINAYVALQRIDGFLSVNNVLGTRRLLHNDGACPVKDNIPASCAILLRVASFGWNVAADSPAGAPLLQQDMPNKSVRASFIERISRRILDGGVVSLLSRNGSHGYSELEMTAPYAEDPCSGWTENGVDIENNMESLRLNDDPGDSVYSFEDCNVVLRNVDASISKGSLFAVIGPTGCGKSTLLAGFFGECRLNNLSAVQVNGSLSYAPQVPWIQQATVRENILFGSTYDEQRYNEVLRCCALDSDLSVLPLGDRTDIGEKGINLSGGQKQRVSLARAAYSYSDIVVMDDVLSAVDAHVGEHIFRHLICGFLSGRTRVLVTHQLSMVLGKADTVLCLGGIRRLSKPVGQFDTSIRNGLPRSPAVGSKGPNLKISVPEARVHSSRSSVLALCHPSRLSECLRSVNVDLANEGTDDQLDAGFIAILRTLELQSTPVGVGDITRSRQGSHDSSGAYSGFPVPSTPSDGASMMLDVPLDDYMDYPPPDVASSGSSRPRLRSSSADSIIPLNNCSYDKLKSLGRDPSELMKCGDVEECLIQKTPIDADTRGLDRVGNNDLEKQSESIIIKEGMSSGAVSWSVYWYYLSSSGGIAFGPGLILIMIWAAVSWYYQNYALGVWLNGLEDDPSHPRRSDKKLVFFIVCCASVVLSVIVKNFYVAIGSLRASQKLHDKLVASVLAATCSWFDSTPIGRITNRFSTDIDEVDQEMMFTLHYFIDCVLGTMQVFIAIAVTVPSLLLALSPVMVYIWWSTFLYIQGSREMKRLESVHKSPVFVLFSETLSGLATIRAFGHENRFFRICTDHTDNMNRCHLYLWMCNRWLACRMQLSGAFVGGAVGYAVVKNADMIGGAAAGLVLVFALNLTDNLTFMARLYADCQMNLNSVERLLEYSSIPSEKYNITPADHNGSAFNHFEEEHSQISRRVLEPKWPHAGVVEFRNISLKYDSAPEPVLRNVTFVVPSKKKVGIVGRTGAGKSSLLVALFRVVEPCGGSIIIDDVDILKLPLHGLRSNLAIVPQDPVLFKGSIRSNLDPFSEKDDEVLWNALSRVRMAEYVANMKGGSGNTLGSLSEKLIADHGANLSVGQRQLLCMARAILRNATVLVMDEATANVDPDTDILIQETIRTEFRECTVLCIAHRLHTVANCDLVLVMDKGKVAEYDSPKLLLENSASIFYGMCKKSGNFNALKDATMEDSTPR